jgi:hypothetical protein
MSSAGDGQSDRERMEQIWNRVQVYWSNSDFSNPGKADRAFEAITDQGLDKFIQPLPGVPFPEAVSANNQSLKDEFGLVTKTEEKIEQRDFQDRQERQVVQEIEDQFREFSIREVADAIQGTAPPELQERFDDVIEQYPLEYYREIAFNEIGSLVDEFDLDAQLVSGDRLRALQESSGRGTESTAQQMRQAEDQVITRLERAFGQRFEDLDDAVSSIRDRIDALQDLDVESGDVRIIGRRDGPPAIRTEIGFGAYEDAAREQAGKAIDATEIDVRRTYEERIGSVRVAGDELQLIDLTPALELPDVAPAIVNPDELTKRFEIDADVAVPPAPEVTDPDIDTTTATPDDASADDDFEDTTAADDTEPDDTDAGDDEQLEGDDVDDGDGDDDERAVRQIPSLTEDTQDALEAVVQAADDGPDAIGAAATRAELFRIAAAIGRGEVPDADIDPLRDAFNSASEAERLAAAREHDGLGEVQRAIIGTAPGEFTDEDVDDVEITGEFEQDDVEDVSDLIDEAEPDRDPQGQRPDQPMDPAEFARQFGDAVGDMFSTGDEIESQRGSDRPDPNQADADTKIASLLGDRLMKGQAWVAAEQERLERGIDDPGAFWDAFGGNIWGNTLSRREFVALSVDMA